MQAKHLGFGDAATNMGAIEELAMKIESASERIAGGIGRCRRCHRARDREEMRATMTADYDPTLKCDLVDTFSNAVIGLKPQKGQMAEVVDATVEFLVLAVLLLRSHHKRPSHPPTTQALIKNVRGAVVQALDDGGEFERRPWSPDWARRRDIDRLCSTTLKRDGKR